MPEEQIMKQGDLKVHVEEIICWMIDKMKAKYDNGEIIGDISPRYYTGMQCCFRAEHWKNCFKSEEKDCFGSRVHKGLKWDLYRHFGEPDNAKNTKQQPQNLPQVHDMEIDLGIRL